MIKYFVNNQGEYLGGFEGVEPPAGAIEVLNPPVHGLDIWNGSVFVTPSAITDDREDQIGREELKVIDAASVRALREFILAKFANDPLLPEALGVHETAAQVSRGKLKPKT
jgi:hypothetical protein